MLVRSILIHLPALELLPLDCSRRVNSRGEATPMQAQWIKLDLDASIAVILKQCHYCIICNLLKFLNYTIGSFHLWGHNS